MKKEVNLQINKEIVKKAWITLRQHPPPPQKKKSNNKVLNGMEERWFSDREYDPAGIIWRRNNVVRTSMRRYDVASTLIWRCFKVVCLLGIRLFETHRRHSQMCPCARSYILCLRLTLIQSRKSDNRHDMNEKNVDWDLTYQRNKLASFKKGIQYVGR